MADLRRALGEDARQARLIETVPKRGYRLAVQGHAAAAQADGPDVERRRWLAIGAAGAALATVIGVGNWLAARSLILVGVGRVANQTGRAELDPLARSVSELTVTYLAKSRDLILVRGRVKPEGGGRRYDLQCRLAIWSGLPTVYFSAVARPSGKVAWSGMAVGPEDDLPAGIHKALTELEARLTA